MASKHHYWQLKHHYSWRSGWSFNGAPPPLPYLNTCYFLKLLSSVRAIKASSLLHSGGTLSLNQPDRSFYRPRHQHLLQRNILVQNLKTKWQNIMILTSTLSEINQFSLSLTKYCRIHINSLQKIRLRYHYHSKHQPMHLLKYVFSRACITYFYIIIIKKQKNTDINNL